MNRWKTLLKNDFLFQLRSGISPLFLGIGIFYAALLFVFPVSVRPWILVFVLLSDPSILGLLFTGALILFEKDQGTMPSLTVTPVREGEYMVSKLLNLTLFSSLCVLIIGISQLMPPLALMLLVLFLGTLAFMFSLLGIIMTSYISNLGLYLIIGGCLQLPFLLPALSLYKKLDFPLFFLLPTRGAIYFIRNLDQGLSVFTVKGLISVLVLFIWTVCFYVLALKRTRSQWRCQEVTANE